MAGEVKARMVQCERELERKHRFLTVSGREIDRVYGPERQERWDASEQLGAPGEYPFTRGIHETLYRGRLWTMRQFAGFGTAEESNARFKYLLRQGQTGLSVAFDMPTIMGYDSDHPRAAGEVGRIGVAIDSIEDMETLFSGIPLDEVSTSMTINGPAGILLALYVVAAERQGVNQDKVSGTIQNDILKEYIAQKSYIFPPAPSVRIITDILDYCSRSVPRWNTISISGYHIREAGSTAAQELAFTLADGMAYVQAGIDAGLDVDSFAPRLSFFFNSHNDLFEEVAKFRAARRIWARVMRERFGAKTPRSWLLRFHTQTAGCSLTAQQPANNVVRTAIQALAAVLGGTQSLHTNSMDEALALPSEEAATVALRTQQILAEESGVANTIDPMGGSYFVEALTDQLEREALDYISTIEEAGGVIAAIDQGFFQKEIADAAYSYQMRVESGEQKILGVNCFATDERPAIRLHKVDPAVEAEQVERLTAFKQRRDNVAVSQALDRVRAAAQGTANLMPEFIAAVRVGVTEGEIVGALKDVFGEYREKPIF